MTPVLRRTDPHSPPRFPASPAAAALNSVLHYNGSSTGDVRSETAADGRLDIYLPCDILQELSIVDTPGTNVILERQQRLTEEFIPRADLVLFVLSTDRPFTDSEVKFLQYIRKWDKRVLFLLNKTDLLETEEELAEVVKFVSKSANSYLGERAGALSALLDCLF